MDTKTSPKIQSESDKEALACVIEDFNEAYVQKSAKERLFREIYQRYRSYLNVYRETTRSSIFIPESFKTIEVVSPRLTAQKPGWRVIPRGDSAITSADRMSQLLSYRYDMQNIHRKLKTTVKQGLIYGTSFMKVGWDSENNSPIALPVDIADIYGDPTTFDWESGFIIHRYYKSLYELENSSIKYKNLDILKMREGNQGDEFEETTRDDLLRTTRFSVQGIPYNAKREGHEILEHWDMVNGKMHVRCIADRTITIRDEDSKLPLNKHPFLVFVDQEVPFEKWGIGEIEPILDLQDELNTTRNQRIDEKNLSIHNMWVVSKTAGVNYKNLVSKPGGVILADDINGIKALEKQNITQDSLSEINLIQADIKDVTGVTNAILGIQGSSHQAATTTAIMTQQANQRFQEKVNNLEFMLIDMARWFLALDGAFLTESVKIAIMGDFGPETVTVKKSDIPKFYDIQIASSPSQESNPDLRRQQLRELFQTIYPVLANPNGIQGDGIRTLLRLLIQSYDLTNTDEIVQGTDHPMVQQVMANLRPDEMQGVAPQQVQQLIKQLLTAHGSLNTPQAQGQAQAQTAPMNGGQQSAQSVTSPGSGAATQAPPMREQLPTSGHTLY